MEGIKEIKEECVKKRDITRAHALYQRQKKNLTPDACEQELRAPDSSEVFPSAGNIPVEVFPFPRLDLC